MTLFSDLFEAVAPYGIDRDRLLTMTVGEVVDTLADPRDSCGKCGHARHHHYDHRYTQWCDDCYGHKGEQMAHAFVG